jgi:ubiquinone/menaquinone biosynthesis C-methylase UbiE
MKEKLQFISPTRVLAEIGLKSGMTVIDYASGAGHWTMAAAEIVAPTGSVLAIEDDINMLSMLQSKAETRHLTNIEVEEVELEKGSSKLAAPADLVIVSNILHLIRDKAAFVAKAANLVSPKGKLVFIDWTKEKTMFGPASELRVDEEIVLSLFEKSGMNLSCSVNAGTDHFGMVFVHKGSENEEN